MICPLFKKNYVYILKKEGQIKYYKNDGFNYQYIDYSICDKYFSGKTKKTFQRFLSHGFVGLLVSKGGEWASYAWLSKTDTVGPDHLPINLQKKPINWIFHCRTKNKYRGEGLYKSCLSKLCDTSLKNNHSVMIDTNHKNVASQKAIIDIGFEQSGALYLFILPKKVRNFKFVTRTAIGHWDKEQKHNYE